MYWRTVRFIFVGPYGVRAGWRLCVFGVVLLILLLITACGMVLSRVRPPDLGSGAAMPIPVIIIEGISAFDAITATVLSWLVFNRDRTWARLGFPLTGVDIKQAIPGFAVGMGTLVLLVLAQAGAGAMHIRLDAARDSALFGLGWLAAHCLVAVFEEVLSRGYFLSTLSDGIGFWPAAGLSSLGFGALHLGNPGESWLGILGTVAMGLVLCLAVRRTGTLWLGIGIHAGWNWAESYLMGALNSGTASVGHLFTVTPHGWQWLSGGAAGPEGSALGPPIVGLIALIIHRCWPMVRFLTAREAEVRAFSAVSPA